jgi:uncharacterized protein YPO0396
MLELSASRKAQAESKKSTMAREAVMQQQEYEDAIRFSIKVQQRESAEAETKRNSSEHHRKKLQDQIDTRDVERKLLQNKKFDEGQKVKDEFAAERSKLSVIRDTMVEDLLSKGINPKYLSEMARCDIVKMQMR